MPEKLERCIQKVKKSSSAVNPYAVCAKSTGYVVGKGSTKHKKKWVKKDKNKIGESTMTKLTKEDIQKYGTIKEIKLLEMHHDGTDYVSDENDADGPFTDEDVLGVDEQEAGYGDETVSVPIDLMQDVMLYISAQGSGAEDDPERDDLIRKLENYMGKY